MLNKQGYALDQNNFKPNTPETILAKDMAIYFDDLSNFAFYLSVVNKLGYSKAYSFWKYTQNEIEEKKHDERYSIRSPKKYFAWKYKRGHY